MEKFIIHLSGEHDTLPRAELEAILQAERIPYRIERQDECVLLMRASGPAWKPIVKRAAFTHACHRYVGESEPVEKGIERLVSSSDWTHLLGSSFAVRVRRFKVAHKELDTSRLERRLGEIIYEGLERKAQVDLTGPDAVIQGIVTSCHFYLGEVLGVVGRGEYDKRRPRTRPFFKPGVLSPRTARGFVNLARTKTDDVFWDPFVGTGGFLVEACQVCRYAIGSELDRIMIKGARMNLHSYGLPNWDLVRADAYDPPVRRAQAIATDPPYGIATSTKHRDTEAIIEKVLERSRIILSPSSYIVFAAPSTLDLESRIERSGFRNVEKHSMRVHRSLTRVIYVAQRKRTEQSSKTQDEK